MKSISLQAILMFLIMGTAFSQIETFEDETHEDTTFTVHQGNYGYNFTTTGDLRVEVISGFGCDQTDSYLSSGEGASITSGSFGSIKLTNPEDTFMVSTSDTWCVYISNNGGNTGTDGDITFTGTLLNGDTIQETIPVVHTQNSWDYLTFSTDWEGKLLTELKITNDTTFTYLALDNIVFNYIASSVSNIQEEKIKIYPNPTVGEIEIIGIDDFIDDLEVKIIDAFGRIVREQSLYNQKIDISGLPNGIYYISINTHNQQITRRIIKH